MDATTAAAALAERVLAGDVARASRAPSRSSKTSRDGVGRARVARCSRTPAAPT